MPVILISSSILLAGRTPGMAALGLRFDSTSSPHPILARFLGKHANWRLLAFAVLYGLLPEIWVQCRQALLMSGWGMPSASASRQLMWACVRLLERCSAVGRLINLVCFLRVAAHVCMSEQAPTECMKCLFSFHITTCLLRESNSWNKWPHVPAWNRRAEWCNASMHN
jgi:hypothetical protein